MQKGIEDPITVAMALFLAGVGIAFAALYAFGAWALSQATGPFIPIVIWTISTILTWLFILSLRHGNSGSR